MTRLHSTCALLAALVCASVPAAAQQTAPGEVAQGFVVFLRGNPIGREDVTTTTSPQGVVISGRNRLGRPLDVITKRAEVRYRPDWTPESLAIEAMVQGRNVTLTTSFSGTEAVSEVVEDGKRATKTDKVSPQTIVVPNLFFGMYEALALRLVGASVDSVLPVYVAPQTEIAVRVMAIRSDRVQTGKTIFSIRRYELAVANPGGDVLTQLSADDAGHLVRLTVPAQSLDIVREDVAASISRTLTHSNPGDEPITIPADGFNIAATLTRPTVKAAKLPAIVLLSGSGAGDRDSVVAGVPIMSQIAGALADAGFLVLRFDKRGYGQSGGRAEAATLSDYAADVRTVMKYLGNQKEVDSKRLALVGHSEGAWVALLAATREKKVAAVVLLATPSTTGAELVLEQQQHVLQEMKVPEAERQAKIDLQKKIHSAVLTGQGWEGVPAGVRRQADTPWFQSLLRYDPAKVLKDVGQPLLIVHGELDQQVPVAHAERLADGARKQRDSKAVEVVTVRGVNHLLVPATSGEVGEYGTLADRNVSKDVTKTIAGWLSKTLIAR